MAKTFSIYDGTVYDPYGLQGTEESRHRFLDIGINRTCECSVLRICPYAPEARRAVQWAAFGSGPLLRYRDKHLDKNPTWACMVAGQPA